MDFTNVNTKISEWSTHLLEAGRVQNPGVLMVGPTLFIEHAASSLLDHVLRRAGRQRVVLLTFALVWQCPHYSYSLGSFPDKGANSQLMGIEGGVI